MLAARSYVVRDVEHAVRSAEAWVHVLVRSAEYWATIKQNKAPVAVPASLTVMQGGRLAGSLNATDDYDSLAQLVFTVVDPPVGGRLTLSGHEFVYTPNPEFWGPDGFDFRVTDGLGLSSTAVISIDVSHINALPVPVCDLASVAAEAGRPFLRSDDLRRDLAALADRSTAALVDRNATAAALVEEGANAVLEDVYRGQLRTRALDQLSYYATDGTLIDGAAAYGLACSGAGSWELAMGTSDAPSVLDLALFAYDRDEEVATTYRLLQPPERGALFASTGLASTSYAQAEERTFLQIGGAMSQVQQPATPCAPCYEPRMSLALSIWSLSWSEASGCMEVHAGVVRRGWRGQGGGGACTFSSYKTLAGCVKHATWRSAVVQEWLKHQLRCSGVLSWKVAAA